MSLPEPSVMCDCGGNYYTAEQVREAVLAERERALAAVSALATESHNREERDVIAKCWHAIKRAAAIRKG